MKQTSMIASGAARDYPRPAVTADVVVWSVQRKGPHVLLIQRRHQPYEGCWALPGGFMEIDETLEQTARRELVEETGLYDLLMEPLCPFDAPDRDPRGRVITMAYLALLDAREAHLDAHAGDDAREARWWPVSELPPLAFDHDRIIEVARAHLRRRLLGDDLGRHLLPDPFTARELGMAFSATLGAPVRARSVLRLLRAAGVIEQVDAGRYRYVDHGEQSWPYL